MGDIRQKWGHPVWNMYVLKGMGTLSLFEPGVKLATVCYIGETPNKDNRMRVHNSGGCKPTAPWKGLWQTVAWVEFDRPPQPWTPLQLSRPPEHYALAKLLEETVTRPSTHAELAAEALEQATQAGAACIRVDDTKSIFETATLQSKVKLMARLLLHPTFAHAGVRVKVAEQFRAPVSRWLAEEGIELAAY